MLNCLANVVLLTLAAPPELSYAEAYDRAETAFRANRLPEAERYYQHALRQSGTPEERAACLERLCEAYVRLGRHDLAIDHGLLLQQWLKEKRDWGRWRECSADLGRWYAALAHTGAAEAQLQQALAPGDGPPLADGRRVTALRALARVAELRG